MSRSASKIDDRFYLSLHRSERLESAPFKSDIVFLDKFLPAESFLLKSKKLVLKQHTEKVADFLQKMDHSKYYLETIHLS